MTIFLILGGVMVVLAILLASAASGVTAGGRAASGIDRSVAVLEAMTGAPAELSKEIDRPFSDRVMEPLQAKAVAVSRRLTGSDATERIRKKLDVAGNPEGWTVERVLAGKVIGAISLFLISLALTAVMGTSFTTRIVMVLGATLIGFFGPNFYLYQKTYDRSARIQRELPDAIDLMTISVESGLAFDAAVQQVARNTEGPLADEFSRVLREMQIGQGRADAMRGLADRTNVEDLKGFVSSMVQADSFGIPIAQVLRVQSQEIRVKRRQRAEERAQQVPVKITIPLIFCILPCLFIAVMGPAVIHIMDSFAK
jgi:tight adherence protein C